MACSAGGLLDRGPEGYPAVIRERICEMAQGSTAGADLPGDQTATLAVGLLAFIAGLLLLVVALALGFHLEVEYASRTAKAQRIAIPAVFAVVAGIVTSAKRRRPWARALGWMGIAAAVVAVLLNALLTSK